MRNNKPPGMKPGEESVCSNLVDDINCKEGLLDASIYA